MFYNYCYCNNIVHEITIELLYLPEALYMKVLIFAFYELILDPLFPFPRAEHRDIAVAQ